MTLLQRLSLAALIAVFALIVVGVTVRATNSGLGCPEWPRCNGSFIPQWDKHTLIEYSHRLTATVTGLIVLALAISAWRSYRRVPAVLYPATTALLLVVLQAGLGGATVLHELPPELVALHLGLALSTALRCAAVDSLCWRERAPVALCARVTAVIPGLSALQARIGDANIRTKAADVVQIALLGTVTILWALGFYLNLPIHNL